MSGERGWTVSVVRQARDTGRAEALRTWSLVSAALLSLVLGAAGRAAGELSAGIEVSRVG